MEDDDTILDGRLREDNVPPRLRVTSIVGDKECILKWKNKANPEFKNKNFMIKYFKPFAVNEGVRLQLVNADEYEGKTNIEYTLKDLDNDTTYNISVIAINKFGMGKPSNNVAVYPSDKEKIVRPPKSV